MTKRCCAFFRAPLLLFVVVGSAQSRAEPKWIPPLIEGRAAGCPDHPGARENRSAVAFARQRKWRAYIAGSATRENDGSCRQTATLVMNESSTRRQIELQHITRSAKELKRDPLEAPDPIRSYSLIDFSSDGRSVLLERTGTDDWRNSTFRDVYIAVLDKRNSTQPMWINVWDLMHWGDCNATVETQGFDKTGNPVLRVRPSVWQSKPRHDCVTRPELWSVDPAHTTATRLPDNSQIPRNGDTSGVDWVTCKNDPDIVSACFIVHGRLAFYNGGPSTRIWRVGTHRMLGIPTETIPENVSELLGGHPFDAEIYGDFHVCPFEKQEAEHMQMVCIESASHLFAKQR